MEINSYFLDTYALIEIIKENENYKKFQDTPNSTGFMNLLELHYILSKDFDSKKADSMVDKLKEILLRVTLEDIKEASKFKLKNSKKKFSYVDCLGYALAYNRKIKFLTGDKEFERLPNVEFVK